MQTALSDFGNMYTPFEVDTGTLSRISLFYGRSVGGFDTNLVQGDVNAFGVAFDIAPQFSVVWGRAYYNQAAQIGTAATSISNIIFGVQINLNAFKAMRGITGSM